jgi:hypothetical protein
VSLVRGGLGIWSAGIAAAVAIVMYLAWTATVDLGVWGYLTGALFWIAAGVLVASLAAVARQRLRRPR